MLASQYGHRDVVKLLLEHSDPRIDLNVKDRLGWTALVIASKQNHQDIVQLIKEMNE